MAAKRRKKKQFRAVQAVKEAAREQIGAPPPTRVVPDPKKKARDREKHKPSFGQLLEE